MAWKDLHLDIADLFGELTVTTELMAEALYQKATREAARVARWRKENPELAKAARQRYKTGEAGKACQKRYLATEKGIAMARKKRAKYRAKMKLLRAARLDQTLSVPTIETK